MTLRVDHAAACDTHDSTTKVAVGPARCASLDPQPPADTTEAPDGATVATTAPELEKEDSSDDDKVVEESAKLKEARDREGKARIVKGIVNFDRADLKETRDVTANDATNPTTNETVDTFDAKTDELPNSGSPELWDALNQLTEAMNGVYRDFEAERSLRHQT